MVLEMSWGQATDREAKLEEKQDRGEMKGAEGKREEGRQDEERAKGKKPGGCYVIKCEG